MTTPERVAYRADDSFTTAVREHLVRLNTARLAVREYNDAHPEHPLKVVRDRIDHQIRVVGFTDVHCDQPPPKGLSRSQDRDYLSAARGGAGTPWRAVRDQYNQFPSLADDVFQPHGLSVYRLTDCRFNVAGIYDFGGLGLFVTIPGGYPDPGGHLTLVPLSEFYRAQETYEAAKVVAP